MICFPFLNLNVFSPKVKIKSQYKNKNKYDLFGNNILNWSNSMKKYINWKKYYLIVYIYIYIIYKLGPHIYQTC